MKLRYVSAIATVLTLIMCRTMSAQHTFSIVAVDPATGEIGSAGASCVPFNAVLISDVHPGIGAVHTQAAFIGQNQAYAEELIVQGLSPQAIIDSLVAHDGEGVPGIRQYGVVTLAGNPRSAAYTGADCMDYKGHITGPTYAIQGNILLGRQILDSMEARFNREPGTLADKLMAALQGANVIGADTRCAPYSSSHSAFLRLARPTDPDIDHLTVNISVTYPPSSQREPIDSLQKLFDAWKRGSSGVAVVAEPASPQFEVRQNSSTAVVIAELRLARAEHVEVALFDVVGRLVRTVVATGYGAGRHELPIATAGLAAGTYYCRALIGATALTSPIVVSSP